ncbi:MAG: hypothetical protein ACRDCE_19315, partial [Cetobacterium sp.]|uniref:hypothetical protein n=1 Tax=Cetobacterium sp. TaxID=2071632 RepID=UPI003EE53C8C
LLEMKVANIISLQAKHGTQFNVQKSRFGIYVLSERIANIDKDLIPLLPPMLNKANNEYKKPFKMNGDFTVHVKNYCERVGLERKDVGGPFTPVWYTPFDPSKSAKVKAVMLDMGWIPTEWNIKKQPLQMWTYRKKLERASFNAFMEKCKPEERAHFATLLNPYLEKHFKDKSVGYKKAILTALDFDLERKTPTFGEIKKRLLLRQFWPSSPKITEDSFASLDTESSHALHLLKERMIWAHRRSLLVGLNENLRKDGKLSGEANPCATPTARMRHKIIVNIPAAGAPFGKECRSMFTGDYNGKTDHFIVRGKNYTPEKIAAGVSRRRPGTNICEILDKGKWEEEGYCYHYI